MKVKLQDKYNTLEDVMAYLKTKTNLELSIVQDEWLTDGAVMLTPGKKCILIKKSAFAGAKVNLLKSNVVDIHPVPPSNFVNNLTQRGFVALIVDAIISGSQNKVAKEVETYLLDVQAS